MSWAKIDDRFLMNPKIMAAGLEARALYLAGILYCAGELTDGRVPRAAVRKLAVLSDVESPDAAAATLVGLNLWETDDETGGYLIHDYHDYNPTSSQVKEHKQEVSEKRSAAGSKGAASRWQNINNVDGKIDGKTIAPREEWQNDSPVPVPVPILSDPVPVPEEEHAPKDRAAREAGAKKQPVPPSPKPGRNKTALSGKMHPAVCIFREIRTETKGRPPSRNAAEEKRAAELFEEHGEATYRRAVGGYFGCMEGSDDWPARNGFSFIAFLRQFDRWEAGKPAKVTPGGNYASSRNGNRNGLGVGGAELTDAEEAARIKHNLTDEACRGGWAAQYAAEDAKAEDAREASSG